MAANGKRDPKSSFSGPPNFRPPPARNRLPALRSAWPEVQAIGVRMWLLLGISWLMFGTPKMVAKITNHTCSKISVPFRQDFWVLCLLEGIDPVPCLLIHHNALQAITNLPNRHSIKTESAGPTNAIWLFFSVLPAPKLVVRVIFLMVSYGFPDGHPM